MARLKNLAEKEGEMKFRCIRQEQWGRTKNRSRGTQQVY